jgi:hypothetical protein
MEPPSIKTLERNSKEILVKVPVKGSALRTGLARNLLN